MLAQRRNPLADTVKIVDPNNGSGTDYTSLDAWEDALGGTPTGNLTAAADNTIAIADCRCTGGTADTTAVDINGWTTDATHYIKVYTNSTYRHAGTYPSGNKYRLEVAGNALTVTENYVWIDGLAIQITKSTLAAYGIALPSALSGESHIYVTNNIIKGVISGDANGIYGIQAADGNIRCYLYNNIIYNLDGSSGTTIFGIYLYLCTTATVYNNTVYNCYEGINAVTGNIIAKNNLCTGNASADYVGTFDTYAKNISGDDTSPDGASYQNKTITFAGAEDFHLASTETDAIDAGDDLSAATYIDGTYLTTDIDGQARGAAWDIGADEYVLAISLAQHSFRFVNDDGDEDASTFKGDLNANATIPANSTVRLRTLINATGDAASAQYQLEYRYKPSGGAFGGWTKVT